MGCELCSNENRENKDLSLNNDNNKKIENDFGKTNSYFSETNTTNLEEKLNEKYSIPKENKNIINYTQNIVNNNIIQYNSRNKQIFDNYENIINSIIKEKSDFASMEFNSAYYNKEDNTKSTIKNNKNHKYRDKKNRSNNHSSKHKSKKIDEEEEKNEDITDNKYIQCIEQKKMENNIKSLLKEINYSKIDKILKQVPERTETTLDKLIKYFKKKSIKLSEVEKAWLIYKWITLNFEYDFEGVNNKNYDITEEATFKRGKTICSGYSKLYKKICDNLDLIVEIITGHSKGFNYELTDKFEESESHAWNAIKIKELWYFIETTWGAGYSEDHKHFIKKFNPYHFFTPPIQFIRSHFPDESKWQLLPKNEIINQKRFMEFIDLKSDFYNLGFDSIEPDLTFNYVNEKGNFKIFFDEEKINPNKLKLMAKLSYIKNKDNLKEIENSTLVIKNKGNFEINYIINKKGKYKLQIYGAKIEEEKYNELCCLILISKKDSSFHLSYPKSYKLFNNSDMEIISPINGTFYNGDKINFQFKTTTYTNLYIAIINNGNNNFIEMEKKENIFKEDNILIYGQKIQISTKLDESNTYNSILEYNVQKNPDKDIITFPKVLSGPKNKLIEPICESLKKGAKIKFKIKSEKIKEIVVFDGDISHKLDKNDDIFSGNILIKGEKNIVQIGYKKEVNYGILYEYNIS